MRKTRIFMVCLMLALALLSVPSERARAMDSQAPAVNLRASVTEDCRIKVTWDFPSNPYTVQVFGVHNYSQLMADFEVNSGYPGNDCYVTPPEQGTYIIFMYYRLVTDSVTSDRATTIVHYRPPIMPLSLKVKEVYAAGLVTLRWRDANSYETGWMVNVTGVDSQMNPVQETIPLRPNDGDIAEVTITSPLEPEGQYTFTVWAVNGGFVGPSDSVSAAIKLKAPTNLSAQVKRNGTLYVDLRWTANSNADYYEIERTNPDGSKTYITTKTADAYWPDTDVKPMSTYTYRVRAIYRDRPEYTSDYSNEATVATTEFTFVTIKPGVSIKPAATAKPGMRIKPGVSIKPAATVKPSDLLDLLPPAIRK